MQKKKILSAVFSLLLGASLVPGVSLPAEAAGNKPAVQTAAAETPLSPAVLYDLTRKGLVLNKAAQDAYLKKSMSPADDYAGYHFVPPAGWKTETVKLGGVSTVHMANPDAASGPVLLELHGGGYTVGLSEKHKLITARVGKLIGAKELYLADYRLAPQHVYPAALNDAAEVYRALLQKGTDPKKIIVYGDSAGGNLAVELALYAKTNSLPQPGALVLASPWASLESSSRSWKEKNDKDLILGKGTPLNEEVQHSSYAGNLSYNDPRLSPVFADLTGLPPMLIQLGGDEVFLDDGMALGRKAADNTVPVTLTIYPTLSHDFALVAPNLEQSRQSLLEIRDFVNRTMAK